MDINRQSEVTVVARSFQGGATFESFDKKKCSEGVVNPIRKLLDTAPTELKQVVVVTCGDPSSKFSEEVQDGTTPTLQHLHEAFPEEVRTGRLSLKICTDWGLNPGSGNALNTGLRAASSAGSDYVLNWSPEIDLTGHMLTLMLYHLHRHNLKLVGYIRNNWFLKFQWGFAQNTCGLWDINTLLGINGFDPICNGDGKTTVHTPDHGDVPLAGMEDIHAYFRASKQEGEFLRWGNVGVSNPAFWNLARKAPGTPEYERNAQKIARQGYVMQEYARQVFPEYDPNDILAEVMRVSINA